MLPPNRRLLRLLGQFNLRKIFACVEKVTWLSYQLTEAEEAVKYFLADARNVEKSAVTSAKELEEVLQERDLAKAEGDKVLSGEN